MTAAQDIRSAVARYLDAVATGPAADIADLYADGATLEDPVGSAQIVDRAAIRDFYSALDNATVKTELLALRVAGNSAAFHFRVSTEMPGQTVTIEPIDVMTFDDQARITSMRAFWSPDDITLG
ncbi:nuclear transport factor 2 family protein [Antrihabitans sp. YC2-6]|uniref:nuclear transport factor 2 family protein n=1 Tax=Antrihabitans sp. YC2-6 TaxID=2799498 RepID=UPI0018F50D51|nr:nuclear transport factor 2 family protein [Antrihabitans sp. YC2-6]MBJ8344706.1 nuclear transport factor 2 family protein [Antrihabitans sp. YC2-6]